MYIRPVSDIHLEFGSELRLPALPTDKDSALVLAGDISNKVFEIVEFVETHAPRFAATILVPGNHEYYGNVYEDVNEAFEKKFALYPTIFFLNNKAININGYQFVGAPLWPNFDNDLRKMRRAPSIVNDFKHIHVRTTSDVGRVSSVPITPSEMNTWHGQSMEFLSRIVDSNSIVITHNAPSPVSIAPHWVGSDINYMFCTDLSEFISDRNPKLWVHGHMHSSSDDIVGNTRIICNPYGYHGIEVNPDFNERLVVEI